MVLETERLYVFPLTPEQLALWISDIPALERALDCTYEGDELSGIFLEIVKGQLELVRRDPEHAAYLGFWLLMTKETRIVVGEADFKGPPDENGEVELGYGLAPAHRGRGYMAEGAGAMCRWALEQPGVTAVTAESEPDNFPSHRVLQRCGMTRCRETAESWWWRRKAQP